MCIYALCARNSLPGQKHAWLMLQHKCKSTKHSILTCLICKTAVIWLQHTLNKLFVSFLMWLTYCHLSFLLAQIRMCLHTKVCVHVNFHSSMQHAPLHNPISPFGKAIPPTLGCMVAYTVWGQNIWFTLYIWFLPGLCLIALFPYAL